MVQHIQFNLLEEKINLKIIRLNTIHKHKGNYKFYTGPHAYIGHCTHGNKPCAMEFQNIFLH